ncbi:PTS sugar transporter subunit IIA, partial [Clostridioides difficile]|uniref:PTS sugar transporter subunit IIA n=1 Tax=Clostridioides difficile TaxID=1496 RepID=UPI001F1D61AD
MEFKKITNENLVFLKQKIKTKKDAIKFLAKDLEKIKKLNDKGVIIRDILNSYFTDDNHGKKLGIYKEDV